MKEWVNLLSFRFNWPVCLQVVSAITNLRH
jgi:hypothetical protein